MLYPFKTTKQVSTVRDSKIDQSVPLPLPTYVLSCFPNFFFLLSLNLEAVELVQEATCVQMESRNDFSLLIQ